MQADSDLQFQAQKESLISDVSSFLPHSRTVSHPPGLSVAVSPLNRVSINTSVCTVVISQPTLNFTFTNKPKTEL